MDIKKYTELLVVTETLDFPPFILIPVIAFHHLHASRSILGSMYVLCDSLVELFLLLYFHYMCNIMFVIWLGGWFESERCVVAAQALFFYFVFGKFRTLWYLVVDSDDDDVYFDEDCTMAIGGSGRKRIHISAFNFQLFFFIWIRIDNTRW